MQKYVYRKKDVYSLIPLAQSGDSKALEEIVRKIQKHVYAVFSHLTNKKEDISDLTQEALLKIAKNFYQLKNINNFKSWVNQIITNIYYDFIRKNPNKFIELTEDDMNEIKDKLGCEPGEKCLITETEKLIRSAIFTLPKNLRITLVLREYEGLSYEEIAKITNTAIGTVKSRISRARLKLQQELKEFI